MAYNEKEIIKKIEAETRNEKLIPTVLSSKRSAFLNKRGSFEKTPGVEIQLKTGSAPNIQHWFRVCAHLNHTNGLWEQIPYFSTDPEYFIYFYWTGNPLNSTYTSSQSEAFYQYIIANIVDSQTGNVGVSSLNVGDEIMFDLSDAWPNGACILSGYGKQDAMCLEYMGFVDNPQLSTQNSVSALSLLSPSTSIPIPFTFSSKTECCNYPNLISCYNIGDIGPEGGIIFSVPGVGSNTSTDTYYEVAQDDIAIGGTPQAGFNVSCGDPPSSQSVQFTITGVSLTFQATYSINVGDTITSTTPGLVPPGTTITIVNYFGALTSIQLSNSLTQTSGQHTFTITTGVSSPWSASGAEWGVHNKPNIITSLDFGTGQKNTDEIDAYPLSPGTPTGGIHPWLDSHDIAATLCKQTEGWFLPSYWEFREMMDQPSVVSQLGLNTSTQNSENYYWTSSHRLPLGTTLPNPDKYAWAYNTDTDNLELAYRCHALSVRPIRRFECEPEPLDPCEDPTIPNTCDCVEYNYREYGCGVTKGVSCCYNEDAGGVTISPPGQVHYLTGVPTTTRSGSIGSNNLKFVCNATDVLGNHYTNSDFSDDSQGYIITVWDKNYNFIGKWKYDNFDSISTSAGWSPNSNRKSLRLEGVTHLEGDHPIVTWGGSTVPGSRQAFFRIESAVISSSTSGCSSLVWGNNTMDPYFDWPYACQEASDNFNINQGRPIGSSACLPYQLVVPTPNVSVGLSNNSCGGSFALCGASPNHCWSICAVRVGTTWYAIPDPWWSGQPYGPIAMENNPIGTTPPPFSSNPYTDQDFTDFYNFIETNLGVGPLSAGQSFIFETTGYFMQFQVTDPNTGQVYTSTSVDAICFKYRGVHNYVIPLAIANNGFPLPTITGDIWTSCCVSSGSSSSLVRPADNDPNSIKINVGKDNSTKRQRFIDFKKPKETGPFGINGYYPLYDTILSARQNSPTPIESRTGEDTHGYHIHNFGGQEYYMPNGLKMGVTQFHGDYDGQIIPETIVQPEITQPEEQIIIQPEQQRIIPPEEPEEETPPPPRRDTGY